MILLKKHVYFVLLQNIVRLVIYFKLLCLLYLLLIDNNNSSFWQKILKIYFYLKIKGGSLGERIRNKIKTESKFDDEQIFKWIKELINGLYYLRKNNVIHRDIKPEYILFELYYVNIIIIYLF